MVRFSHTICYVKDVPKQVAFYEKAFDIKPKFVHESGSYAELETGDTTLAFAQEALGKENLPQGFIANDSKRPPFACEIVFTVDDVKKAYEKACKAQAHSVAEPKEKPWGQTVAYVRDPEGVLIELASQM